MNLFTISAGQIAGSVWNNAARTLTADPFTDAVGGLIVWSTHATRKLTSLGTAIVQSAAVLTSIANGVTVDLRPGANTIRDITAMVSAAAIRMDMWDGTNALPGANSSAFPQPFVGTTSSVGLRINNASGGSGFYMYTAKDISIA